MSFSYGAQNFVKEKRSTVKVHTMKPTNALMFKLYFYTQLVITPTCFHLPSLS